LTLFAKKPDSYDVVHQDLFKLASKQGSMGPYFINERLLTTELCEAMQANDKVGYKLIIAMFIIIILHHIFLGTIDVEKDIQFIKKQDSKVLFI
jgi:hypothetical protein